MELSAREPWTATPSRRPPLANAGICRSDDLDVFRRNVNDLFYPARVDLPRWSADAAKLCIKISRESLESELEGLLGRPISSWVDFRFKVDYAGAAAQSWLATLGLLLAEIERSGGLVQVSTPYREHLERLLIAGLLFAQPNEFTAELLSGQRPARPRTVGRVVALIEEHPERHYTAADLARHAGVSARRLQQGFREHVGMTPLEFLRATRLERARRDLLDGDGSVTDVALRWGFTHLGRFAEAYRERFGTLPSATRRGLEGPDAG